MTQTEEILKHAILSLETTTQPGVRLGIENSQEPQDTLESILGAIKRCLAGESKHDHKTAMRMLRKLGDESTALLRRELICLASNPESEIDPVLRLLDITYQLGTVGSNDLLIALGNKVCAVPNWTASEHARRGMGYALRAAARMKSPASLCLIQQVAGCLGGEADEQARLAIRAFRVFDPEIALMSLNGIRSQLIQHFASSDPTRLISILQIFGQIEREIRVQIFVKPNIILSGGVQIALYEKAENEYQIITADARRFTLTRDNLWWQNKYEETVEADEGVEADLGRRVMEFDTLPSETQQAIMSMTWHFVHHAVENWF